MLQATFRQLQTFVAVAQTGSFSAAANSLMISQQSISNQIRALERKLGHGLFDRRVGASPVLSAKGQALLERAPALLAEAEDLETRVGAARAPLRVRIATGEHILFNVLMPHLSLFQIDWPELQIEFIQVASPTALMNLVLNGQADLGYCTFTRGDLNPLAEVVVTADFGLYSAPGHPLAQALPLEPRAGLPVILPLKASIDPSMSERLLALAGFPDIVAVTHAQTAQTRMQLAMRGLGVCLLFREFAADYVARGDIVDLGVKLQPCYRCAVRRPGAMELEPLRAIDAFVAEQMRLSAPQGL
jgi:DNA-binding transcriptional LysR family regulator